MQMESALFFSYPIFIGQQYYKTGINDNYRPYEQKERRS